jgi:hypothetical protein
VDERRISRRELLVQSARRALALKALGLAPGDRIALNMPSIPEQIFWIEGAKRAGIVYTPVFGGFSDKTLSDRIADAGARIVITADGGWRNAQVAAFKAAYTDPALDNFVAVATALDVVRARLADPALAIPADVAGHIADTIARMLSTELTVERADVMRGAGRALAELSGAGGLSAAQASAVRIALAQALTNSPPRVEAVIVERHAGIADIVWRPERDRWAHELLAAADVPACRWAAWRTLRRCRTPTLSALSGHRHRRCRSKPTARCSSSIPRARPASPRASSTAMAAGWPVSRTPCAPPSMRGRATCSTPWPIRAGSRGRPISSRPGWRRA